MVDLRYFNDRLNNLDDNIKKTIEEIVNSKIKMHIDKTKKFSDEINKLLNNLGKDIPQTIKNSLLYVLGELTDNIEQHSNYSNAYVFLKHKNMENAIEMLIFDDGLSIPFVFEKNKINFSKDKEAIKLALEGITTKKEDISRGFGLSTSKKIILALKGSMHIISRRGALYLQDKIIEFKELDKELMGTLIIIKLKIPKEDLNIYQYVE